MANIRKAGHNKLDGHVPIQICPWLHWMLDNGDKVLDGETNKELATVASFLATRGTCHQWCYFNFISYWNNQVLYFSKCSNAT